MGDGGCAGSITGRATRVERGENTTDHKFERIDVVHCMIRPIRRIDTTARFEKEFGRLEKRVQQLAHKKDALFRTDAFHPSLETHKLGGVLKDDWAYSVNKQYRVHFYFVDGHTVLYISIGTHGIYR